MSKTPDDTIKGADIIVLDGCQGDNQATALKPKEIDSRYIEEYLRNPKAGKLAALRAAEHPNPTRARAWQIHDRLAERIDKGLDKLIKQDAALGRATLVRLTKSAQSESVQHSSAVKLMEYADKAKPAKVIIQTDTPEDLDKEIARLTQSIKEGENQPESDTKH